MMSKKTRIRAIEAVVKKTFRAFIRSSFAKWPIFKSKARSLTEQPTKPILGDPKKTTNKAGYTAGTVACGWAMAMINQANQMFGQGQ